MVVCWMNVHCPLFVCVYRVTCLTAQNMGSFEFAFFFHFGGRYDSNSFKSLINFCVKDSKSHVILMVKLLQNACM